MHSYCFILDATNCNRYKLVQQSFLNTLCTLMYLKVVVYLYIVSFICVITPSQGVPVDDSRRGPKHVILTYSDCDLWYQSKITRVYLLFECCVFDVCFFYRYIWFHASCSPCVCAVVFSLTSVRSVIRSPSVGNSSSPSVRCQVLQDAVNGIQSITPLFILGC